MNKLRYAKEGAKDIMDRTCADLPWQVWLEVDGRDIQIPKVCNKLYLMVIHVILFSYFSCQLFSRMLRA